MDERLRRIETWLPVTDEMLIDLGMGTPEMIARDQARSAELARWRRSWRGRWAEVRSRFRGAFWRLNHASRALRGIDCEGGG